MERTYQCRRQKIRFPLGIKSYTAANGINTIPIQQPSKPKKKSFKDYLPGYIHIDITQVYTQEGKRYVFVDIERITSFCFAFPLRKQKSTRVIQFLKELTPFPTHILQKILPDNGIPFTYHQGDYIHDPLKKYVETWVSNIASLALITSELMDK